MKYGWMGSNGCRTKSEKKFHDLIMSCKTILWNGPMGVFEFSNFAKGTISVGKSIGAATAKGAFL